MNDDGLTTRHTTAGLRWLFANRERLGLSLNDLGVLLGGLDGGSVRALQQDPNNLSLPGIPADMTERIGLLLGIHRSLAVLAPDNFSCKAFEMFQMPIDLVDLQGQSIKTSLLSKPDITSMRDMRRQVGGLSL